jgi:hypothetical protein
VFTCNSVGWDTVTDEVALQFSLSVTVTWYMPAVMPDMEDVCAPFDHW